MTKEEKKYLKDIGTLIKTRREELKITQAILAQKVKLSRYHIIRLERGQHAATIIILKRIAKELNCSIAELSREQ